MTRAAQRMWRPDKLRRWWKDYGFTIVVVLVLMAVPRDFLFDLLIPS
jgi:hypothetical protein